MLTRMKYVGLATLLTAVTGASLLTFVSDASADKTPGETDSETALVANVASNPQIAQTVTARKVVSDDSQQFQQTPNSDKNTEEAFQLLYSYMNDSGKVCSKIPHYTALLEKHVFADDELQDPEKLQIKVREQPFSVYAKWEGDGQQVLYVDGENENRLIAKPTNGLAIIRDIWRLDPESRQAMRGCRYPITHLGISRLNRRIHDFYNSRETREGATITYREESLDGRPLMIFDVSFHSPQECQDYSRSQIMFDAVGKWIVGVENHGWTSNGQPGELVEKYIYHDINFDTKLSATDFAVNNTEYGFE